MCGIFGIISKKMINSSSISDGLEAIKHRGPDDSLVLNGSDYIKYSTNFSSKKTQSQYGKLALDLKSNFWFGFNRLSLVDFSDNAMQPFHSKESNTVFMFNGELYNYLELKVEHLSEETFISNSDSEVVWKLYIKFGNEFIHLLNGMFVIVIYDFKEEKLKVWRDRLGIKPIFYSFENGTFIVSSEVKAIHKSGLVKKEINYTGLAYSMYLTTCPSPLTIYKNIHLLQAAHFLSYDFVSEEIEIKPYWVLKYNPSKNVISFSEFSDDVDAICKNYSIKTVNSALMLSGGLDSGLLAFYLSKQLKDLKSVHISDAKNTEYKYAQLNAENANSKFVAYKIPENPSEKEIELFLSSEEEPNSGPEPALFCTQKSKEDGYKVLYNALGPDEIFGGYEYFKRVKWLKKLPNLKYTPVFLIPGKYKAKFQEIATYGIESMPFIGRSLFSWEEISLFLEKNNQAIPEHPISYIKNQIIALYPDFEKIPALKKVSYYDIFYYISSHHTFRSDQSAMKYGIEMRFPFLDHNFLEKYFNQKNTFQSLNTHLKPQFRSYAQKVLPMEVLNMKKEGFQIPFENWEIRNPQIHLAKNRSQKWYLLGLEKIFPDYK